MYTEAQIKLGNERLLQVVSYLERTDLPKFDMMNFQYCVISLLPNIFPEDWVRVQDGFMEDGVTPYFFTKPRASMLYRNRLEAARHFFSIPVGYDNFGIKGKVEYLFANELTKEQQIQVMKDFVATRG